MTWPVNDRTLLPFEKPLCLYPYRYPVPCPGAICRKQANSYRGTGRGKIDQA